MILANEKYLYQQPVVKETQKTAGETVRPGARTRRRREPQTGTFYAGVVLIVFILAIFLTTRYAQIAMTGYKVVDIRKEIAALQVENDRLLNEINSLKSLSRIEQIAMTKLGMIKPDVQGIGYVAMKTKGKETPDIKSAPAEGAGEKAVAKKENGLLRAFASMLSNWQGKLAPAEAGQE